MAIFSASGGARSQTEWRAGCGAQHGRRITTRRWQNHSSKTLNDPWLLDEWISHWSDVTDFEVYAVITSAEAAGRVSSHL